MLNPLAVKAIVGMFWIFAVIINIPLSLIESPQFHNNTIEEDILHYQCWYCDKIFLSESILDWHMSTEHKITGTLF